MKAHPDYYTIKIGRHVFSLKIPNRKNGIVISKYKDIIVKLKRWKMNYDDMATVMVYKNKKVIKKITFDLV